MNWGPSGKRRDRSPFPMGPDGLGAGRAPVRVGGNGRRKRVEPNETVQGLGQPSLDDGRQKVALHQRRYPAATNHNYLYEEAGRRSEGL